MIKHPYDKHGLCDGLCRHCVYRSSLSGNSAVFCQYISLTEKMRPCPAGRGCTVFVEGRPLAEKRNVAVIQKTMKRCDRCHKIIEAKQGQKYCDECRQIRNREMCRERQRKVRAQEREKALAKVRHCDWCGVEYHSFTDKSKYCQECSKRFTHRKRPKDE